MWSNIVLLATDQAKRIGKKKVRSHNKSYSGHFT